MASSTTTIATSPVKRGNTDVTAPLHPSDRRVTVQAVATTSKRRTSSATGLPKRTVRLAFVLGQILFASQEGAAMMMASQRTRIMQLGRGSNHLHLQPTLAFHSTRLPRLHQPALHTLRSRMATSRHFPKKTWSSLAWRSDHDDNMEETTATSSLQALEAQIQRLASEVMTSDSSSGSIGLQLSSFNVQSPQQVSRLLFDGTVQSVSRAVLTNVVSGKTQVATEQHRQLAALVLEYRRCAQQTRCSHGPAIQESTGTSSCLPCNTTKTKQEIVPVLLPHVSKRQHPTASAQRAFSSLPVMPDDEDAGYKDNRDKLHGHQQNKRSQHDRDAAVERDDVSFFGTTTQEDSSSTADPHQRLVDELFASSPTSQLDSYWKDGLRYLTRPAARALVSQLQADCPLGYDPAAVPNDPLLRRTTDAATTTTAGKKGSFLAFCREQKTRYPDCIILCRCGDFYETFGVDALMLIEHCGLNPMGSKVKAGCPYRNVQATIDGLTAQGLRVAVYEEAADTEAGTSKSRLKSRFLAQIVSAASPTYLYDLLLLSDGSGAASTVTMSSARPYCGILSLAAGYTLVEVSWDEQTVRVSERLTAQAVACRLAATPPADPLFYVPPTGGSSGSTILSSEEGSISHQSLPFLPSRRELAAAGHGAKSRTHILPPPSGANSLFFRRRTGKTYYCASCVGSGRWR